jgi:hypothetical protein
MAPTATFSVRSPCLPSPSPHRCLDHMLQAQSSLPALTPQTAHHSKIIVDERAPVIRDNRHIAWVPAASYTCKKSKIVQQIVYQSSGRANQQPCLSKRWRSPK